jgi:hypothetical protein
VKATPPRVAPVESSRTLERSPRSFRIPDQTVDAAKLQIAIEDQSDGLGFLRINGEFAVLQLIAQRHHPADPETLALGGCDLVPDALGRNLAFELGE